MKKKITLLFISFFILASCSSDEDSSATPVAPVAPLTIKAALNGGGVDVSWSVVGGTGITYNVYRNDNPVKINATPLTEAKFKDVLTSTGSFTYTVTANSGGMESAKGVVSEKVILELPKTRTVESISTRENTKSEYTYTYDATNITKIISQTIKSTTTRLSDQTVTVYDVTAKYTYNEDLITKVTYYNVDNTVKSSYEYVYNTKRDLTSMIRKGFDGTIDYTINYAYGTDGLITETSDYPDWGTWVYTYEKGNMIKYVHSTSYVDMTNYVETSDFVYDTKNMSTKNILGFNTTLIGVNSANNEASSSVIVTEDGNVVNTRLSRSEYTYNENGYVLTKMRFHGKPTATVLNEKTVITYY
ncbi:hypothetical protein [Flavobacterium sp. AJR]|uniref:hypothetical protein n=1 Tax=Flavobacterium sp. AJR TaxID=1979369 RepID=UPI00057ED02D|nr:hypothetical protein [Flavobacterium sp. AJR]KIC00753.1 hypothetical protein OA88_17700 [Flavobacterium sp. JRM]OUL62862.1 hypothetical protein B8T70_08035 [Flavobacterium sp. AJR]